jgi:glucokinase
VLLAGDIGGTKTLLGLFERGHRRPHPIAIRSYLTSSFHGFSDILDAFANDVDQEFVVEAAAAGVAGPVIGDIATLTNIAWNVGASEIADKFGTSRTKLLNDLEAMANSVEVLTSDEVVVLQAGVAHELGRAVVIAAGTGLGEAYLYRINGRLTPMPSEGGHADFAARNDREIELLRMLCQEYGRAEVEHVLSGPGLVNLHRFTHGVRECRAIPGRPTSEGDLPAAISEAALSGRCEYCVEALSMFVSIYGAEAGNLALRGVATAGVYVGGGIAPKILPALQDGRFIEAFRTKGAMSGLVTKIPVKVILNPNAGLLGAAVYAQEMLGDAS